ncbi:MAG: hypothetical protein AB7K24_01545 [Gemmataceae bacterium]
MDSVDCSPGSLAAHGVRQDGLGFFRGGPAMLARSFLETALNPLVNPG